MKLTVGFLLLVVSSLATLTVPTVSAQPVGRPVGPRDPSHTIYVTSQGKYYDTLVPISGDKGLPWDGHNQGSFQQLYPTGGPTGGPSTPYGQGDSGYRGGRWWIDSNSNGYQDAYDTFFLCPLLGPGRDSP
jgi:hypothetical protein